MYVYKYPIYIYFYVFLLHVFCDTICVAFFPFHKRGFNFLECNVVTLSHYSCLDETESEVEGGIHTPPPLPLPHAHLTVTLTQSTLHTVLILEFVLVCTCVDVYH